MGGSKSKSKTKESTLSRAQAKILESREQLYRQFIFPEIKAELGQSNAQSNINQFAQAGLANVNQAYEQAQTDVKRSLAQREVSGGFQGSALTGLEAARAGAAATAMNNAFAQNKQYKSNLLNIATSMSPQPTTAAPFHQRTSSKSGM